MKKLLLFISFLLLLACKEEKICEFEFFIKSLKVLDSLEFDTAADLDTLHNTITVCDSIILGKGFYPVGIIHAEKEFYSILAVYKPFIPEKNKAYAFVPKNEIMIVTLDRKGKILGALVLKQNQRERKDGNHVFYYYTLKHQGILLKKDTSEFKSSDAAGDYTVRVTGYPDTVKYSNGKPYFEDK